VQPRAASCAITEHTDGRLKLRVSAPPAEGKANRQAAMLLAKLFSVAGSRVRLGKGAASRDKTFLIQVSSGPSKLPDPLALPTAPTRL